MYPDFFIGLLKIVAKVTLISIICLTFVGQIDGKKPELCVASWQLSHKNKRESKQFIIG